MVKTRSRSVPASAQEATPFSAAVAECANRRPSLAISRKKARKKRPCRSSIGTRSRRGARTGGKKEASRKSSQDDVVGKSMGLSNVQGKQDGVAHCKSKDEELRSGGRRGACVALTGCQEVNNRVVAESHPDQKWKTEQDDALQNAYFLVRPAPNFWLEVSKKVPGKTPKECYDRFYSAYPTPPIAQPRSRRATTQSPIRSLGFLSPASSHSRKSSGRGKQGLLKAHQTVRYILRKQQAADKIYETDIFMDVEQVNSVPMVLQDCFNHMSSPIAEQDSKHSLTSAVTPSNLLGAEGRVEEEEMKSLTHMHETVEGQLLSPEVLKRETNPGRLDRYLDLLHLRRIGKQRTSSDKGMVQNRRVTDKCTIGKPKVESKLMSNVSSAREALLSDAKAMLLNTLLHQPDELDDDDELVVED